MKEKKLILSLDKEVSNSKFEKIILVNENIEDVIKTPHLRYLYHEEITECFDSWTDADYDDKEEVYFEVDDNDDMIDDTFKYVIEEKMHNIISSKNYNDVYVEGRCKKGTIYLYTE